MTQRKRPFENIVGKGENAGNQHFLCSHSVFNPIMTKIIILSTVKLSFGNAFDLDQAKILSFGKELNKCMLTRLPIDRHQRNMHNEVLCIHYFIQRQNKWLISKDC